MWRKTAAAAAEAEMCLYANADDSGRGVDQREVGQAENDAAAGAAAAGAAHSRVC